MVTEDSSQIEMKGAHMDQKWNARITVIFLCGILLCFTIADYFVPDRYFSENENRILAKEPALNVKAVRSGQYMKDYETYVTDQFVSRDTWITLKTRGDIALQKKAVNGVYLGADGYLIEQHLPEDVSEEKAYNKLTLLAKLGQNYDIQVMMIPTAGNILIDKMPSNAPAFDEKAFLEQVKDTVGAEHVIDLFPTLSDHAGEYIYYQTDHHWTTLGAYYAYLEWAKQMEKEAYPYQVSELQTVSDTFLGTLHSKINLPHVGDLIQIFPETTTKPINVTYDLVQTTHSYYEDSYLSTKNQYGYFLDENHPLISIDTGYDQPGALFLIKNSYANSLVPLLAPHYENIHMVDLRYYRDKLFPLIDSYKVNGDIDVMVVYDPIHFVEEFQYY
jgi:hypothetical protein